MFPLMKVLVSPIMPRLGCGFFCQALELRQLSQLGYGMKGKGMNCVENQGNDYVN